VREMRAAAADYRGQGFRRPSGPSQSRLQAPPTVVQGPISRRHRRHGPTITYESARRARARNRIPSANRPCPSRGRRVLNGHLERRRRDIDAVDRAAGLGAMAKRSRAAGAQIENGDARSADGRLDARASVARPVQPKLRLGEDEHGRRDASAAPESPVPVRWRWAAPQALFDSGSRNPLSRSLATRVVAARHQSGRDSPRICRAAIRSRPASRYALERTGAAPRSSEPALNDSMRGQVIRLAAPALRPGLLVQCAIIRRDSS